MSAGNCSPQSHLWRFLGETNKLEWHENFIRKPQTTQKLSSSRFMHTFHTKRISFSFAECFLLSPGTFHRSQKTCYPTYRGYLSQGWLFSSALWVCSLTRSGEESVGVWLSHVTAKKIRARFLIFLVVKEKRLDKTPPPTLSFPHKGPIQFCFYLFVRISSVQWPNGPATCSDIPLSYSVLFIFTGVMIRYINLNFKGLLRIIDSNIFILLLKQLNCKSMDFSAFSALSWNRTKQVGKRCHIPSLTIYNKCPSSASVLLLPWRNHLFHQSECNIRKCKVIPICDIFSFTW